jgi:hypothetical protein
LNRVKEEIKENFKLSTGMIWEIVSSFI